jgi:hypothetical protein
MREVFTRAGRLLRENQLISGVAVGIALLFLTPFINMAIPDEAATKKYIAAIAVFVGRFWREIAMGIVCLAVVRLYFMLATVRLPKRTNMKDLVVTVSTPPVTVGIHPVEVRLMKRMKEEGGGPFEIKKIFEFLPAERDGWLPMYTWVHLQNLIALGFVKIDIIKGSKVVPPSPLDLYPGPLAGLLQASAVPRTEETKTALYTLTDRGRKALDKLETMPNEFTTRF